MGEVYKARDTRLDRDVAIKILQQADSPETTGKILKEARAVARLNHPNIATLYDVVEGGDGPFLVLEYVAGERLDVLVARGECDAARAVGIVIQLLDALAYAHHEGVIHRDVKPANVLLTREGQIKLLDLGIAQTMAAAPDADTVTSPDITTATTRSGTPAYMAPERLGGRTASARSDIYSVGVVLFELLTSRRPFEAKDMMELAIAVTTGEAPHVSSLRPGIPPALDAVVARALARDPAARYASAAAFRDDLTQLQHLASGHLAPISSGAVAAPTTPQPRRRLARVAAGLGLAAVMIIGLGWMAFGRGSPAQGEPVRIAILPAINASEDPAIESLGAILTSTLTDNLSAIPGVMLVSSNPAAYRAASRDARRSAADIARGYVVDLKLQKVGGRVSVEAQLVHSADATVWRDRFEGDALDVDRFVTEQVAAALEAQGAFRPRLTDEARKQLRRLPTTDSAAFNAYWNGRAELERALAQAVTNRAGLEQAVASFGDAVRRDDGFALAHASIAQAWAALHAKVSDTEKAAALKRVDDAAKQALALDPGRALVQAAVGGADQLAARQEDAERHWREAARLAPDDDTARRALATLLAARQDWPGAIAEAQSAVRLRPSLSNNHYALGYYLIQAGRYQDAIPPLLRAAELRPDRSENFTLLGSAYHRAGDVQQAIGNYAQAMRLKDPKAHLNLGVAYYAAGQFDDALDSFQKAIEIDPTSATAHRNAADALERLGRTAEMRRKYADAIARADVGLKANPTSAALLAQKGYCEAKLGRINDARQNVAAAVTLSRRNSQDIMFKSAVVEALAGHTDRALQDLEAALTLGYPVIFARDDWDLRTLRHLPSFQTLVHPKAP